MDPLVQQTATQLLTASFLTGGVLGAPLCGSLLVTYGDHRAFGFLGVTFAVLLVANGIPDTRAGYESVAQNECSLQRTSNDRISCSSKVSAAVLVMLAVNFAMAGFESTYAYFMEEVEHE